nr:MAG TPA: E2 glycoprotein [Caudoviricetes sp.]
MQKFIEQITVADIVGFIVGLATFIKAVEYIVKGLSNNLLNSIKKSIEPISRRLDEIDKEQCKNYLIQCFHENRDLSESEKQRVHEVYQHYRELGGNSYIKEEFERLQDEGKL